MAPKKPKVKILTELDNQIICTLLTCFKHGIDVNSIDESLPNYRVLVELKFLAANTFKEEEKYYEFLEDCQKAVESSSYSGLEESEVLNKLEIEHQAVYNFMKSRNYLGGDNV